MFPFFNVLGDIGFYEEDGHVTISDRLKELIKVKGLQVISSTKQSGFVMFAKPVMQNERLPINV